VANASLRIHTRRGYNSTGSRLWPGGRKCLPLKSYPDTKRSGCPLEMPNPAQVLGVSTLAVSRSFKLCIPAALTWQQSQSPAMASMRQMKRTKRMRQGQSVHLRWSSGVSSNGPFCARRAVCKSQSTWSAVTLRWHIASPRAEQKCAPPQRRASRQPASPCPPAGPSRPQLPPRADRLERPTRAGSPRHGLAHRLGLRRAQ